jgi:hypothetical protein
MATVANTAPSHFDFSSFLIIGFTMKTLVSALMISATVFTGAAYAADSSTPTRAEVIADMQQARGAGLISDGEQAYPVAISTANTKDRAQVQAELSAAIAAGQVSIGEQAYPLTAGTSSSKTRAEVKAELFDYASSHPNAYVAA